MNSISTIQTIDMSSGALGSVPGADFGSPRVHTYIAAGVAAAATSVARKWGRPPRGEPR